MAAPNLIEAGFKCGDIERAGDLHRATEIENRRAWFELLQEPNAFLREGQRRRPICQRPRNGRRAVELPRRLTQVFEDTLFPGGDLRAQFWSDGTARRIDAQALAVGGKVNIARAKLGDEIGGVYISSSSRSESSAAGPAGCATIASNR
jgi:hypothetical protein